MLALQPNVQITSSSKSSWPHLDEKTVMNRVTDLKRHPNLINQGALGLCGEAAFYHHIIQRDPAGFFAMAYVLFLDGASIVGKLLIDPDSDLLSANYSAIVSDRGSMFPPIPPQADWMLLAALRDSQNEILDYEGQPEEGVAEGSDYNERWQWYDKSGLYKKVTLDTDTELAHVKASGLKTSTNHVSMWINADMIQPSDGRHVISLESPVVIDEANDLVTFDYWTYGHASFDIASLTVAKFTNNYLGAIIATY